MSCISYNQPSLLKKREAGETPTSQAISECAELLFLCCRTPLDGPMAKE